MLFLLDHNSGNSPSVTNSCALIQLQIIWLVCRRITGGESHSFIPRVLINVVKFWPSMKSSMFVPDRSVPVFVLLPTLPDQLCYSIADFAL